MANMKENLVKLQELQLKAYEYGLNMEISTRETNTEEPWICGYVKTEEALFGNNESALRFDFYNFNPDQHEALLEVIDHFIETHHYMSKYGQQWAELVEDHRNANSWLVVKIGDDEIYVDEVAGKRYLVEGGENPKFYASEI